MIGINGARSATSILTTKVSFGAKSDASREKQVPVCVIDSDAYKFVIGTEVLDAMDAVLYVKRKRLELVGNDGRVFRLPLFTKAEVK